MSRRGVHFALNCDDAASLCAVGRPAELRAAIQEIEERCSSDPALFYETDKAWEGIHRALTDGRLLYSTGPFPLAFAVLGGDALDVGDDFTACLVEPEWVEEAAVALQAVTRDLLRERYFGIDPNEYSYRLDEEDFEYVWGWFEGLPDFFARAAKARRAVLFTVDC